jgi:hypothetical protein
MAYNIKARNRITSNKTRRSNITWNNKKEIREKKRERRRRRKSLKSMNAVAK